MPLEKNKPSHSRKKDGKPHKDKNHSSISLPLTEKKSFIPGYLIEQLFDELNIDMNHFVSENISGSEYSQSYYCPSENAIYIYTSYLGSGWKGSPTEFWTYFQKWQNVNNSIIPPQFYFDFMERNDGAVLGYNIYEVPKIKIYDEY